MKKLRVLSIEDDEFSTELLTRQLSREGFKLTVKRIETREEMDAALDQEEWDVVLSDHDLPRFDGFAALSLLKKKKLDIPFILVSGILSEDLAVKAMKSGAQDYIMKGNMKRLGPSIQRELRDVRVRQTLREKETTAAEANTRFRTLVENIQEVFWMTDITKKTITYVSPLYEEVWGRTCESLYRHPNSWMDHVHSEDRERIAEVSQTNQFIGDYDLEFRIVRPNGSVRWIRSRAFPVRDDSNRVTHIVGISEDITKRKEANIALRESESRFSGIVSIAMDAIIMIDEDHRIMLFNRGAEDIFGYRISEVDGKRIKLLIPDFFSEKHQSHLFSNAVTDKAMRKIDQREFKLYGIRKNGARFPAEITVSTLHEHGKRLFTAVIRDITERKEKEDQIKRLAFFDPLTSLPNRAQFVDLLKKSIQESIKDNGSLSVLIIDLDNFRQVNDTLGHPLGDLLLQEVSFRLKQILPPANLIARIGGDEFGMILPMTGQDHATLVAEKILKALEKPFTIRNIPISIEPSIGISIAPGHGQNDDILLQRADIAMYEAKRHGCAYMIYSSKCNKHSASRLALMGELRPAIQYNQLILHFQPKIDLKTRIMTGVEALVRWNHPERGLIPPGDFILPAEQTGLIAPITKWVIKNALHQCGVWHQNGHRISVAVNISARNLHNFKIVDQISATLQHEQLDPSILILELTESAIMTDEAIANQVLGELRKMGVRLSIDDFGTGYSSLSYLKRLEVDMLKIDQSFVKNMANSQDDALIVDTIIKLAHNLGLKVVAEGVENKETFNQLASFDCDFVQGYFITHPLSIKELDLWLLETEFYKREQSTSRDSDVIRSH